MFQYFSSERRPDGSTFMKPEDLLAAMVAIYPAAASAADRAGFLPGEHRAAATASQNKQVGRLWWHPWWYSGPYAPRRLTFTSGTGIWTVTYRTN